MISLRKIPQFLLDAGLILLISTTIAFVFAPGESWAATPFMQGIDQSHTQIASMDKAKVMTKNLEGKAQEAIGNMTGNAKNQVDGKSKQFEAQTQDAINDSIQNPNYQPGGKTKKAEHQDSQAREELQTKVRETFR